MELGPTVMKGGEDSRDDEGDGNFANDFLHLENSFSGSIGVSSDSPKKSGYKMKFMGRRLPSFADLREIYRPMNYQGNSLGISGPAIHLVRGFGNDCLRGGNRGRFRAIIYRVHSV